MLIHPFFYLRICLFCFVGVRLTITCELRPHNFPHSLQWSFFISFLAPGARTELEQSPGTLVLVLLIHSVGHSVYISIGNIVSDRIVTLLILPGVAQDGFFSHGQ